MKKMKWLLILILSICACIFICIKVSWWIKPIYWIPMLIIFIIIGNFSMNRLTDIIMDEEYKEKVNSKKIINIKDFIKKIIFRKGRYYK